MTQPSLSFPFNLNLMKVCIHKFSPPIIIIISVPSPFPQAELENEKSFKNLLHDFHSRRRRLLPQVKSLFLGMVWGEILSRRVTSLSRLSCWSWGQARPADIRVFIDGGSHVACSHRTMCGIVLKRAINHDEILKFKNAMFMDMIVVLTVQLLKIL